MTRSGRAWRKQSEKCATPGFMIWNVYGRIESAVAGYIQQGERSLGEMKP